MMIKAIVARPDRGLTIKRLKQRQVEGNVFTIDGNKYIIHPDRFVLTNNGKIWPFHRSFKTFYYTQGVSLPLPFPDFQKVEEPVNDEQGNAVMVDITDKKGKVVGKMQKKTQTFPKIINNGIPAEELAAIFNPWFYRTIAPQAKSMWDQLLLMGVIGSVIGIAYIIYGLSSGHFHTVPVLPPTPTITPSPTVTP